MLFRSSYASILGQVDVSDDKSLQTILSDASHGVNTGKGPEVPVIEKPENSKLTHWLLREAGAVEKPYVFGARAGSFGSMRTFVHSPNKKRATLSIRHSYVKVFLNGVPVVSSANWWSADWNVQVDLKAGLNQIEAKYVKGRGARGYAPVYLFDPLGEAFDDLETSKDEASLKALASAYDKEHGLGEGEVRISAVPNQLAFSPTEVRVRTSRQVRLTFDNPDIQIHNLVIVKPGSENEVGSLADQMAQDPDAFAKHFVPTSDKIVWSSPLVNPNQRVVLDFSAPAEPGRYPFICTFPGHWRVMKGTLVVD